MCIRDRNYLEGGHKQLSDYLNEVYPLMLVTSDQIKKLMVLNQRELYESAAFHESSAQRAIMPGLIVILTSLLFTFVFTYLIHHYFVSPIISLTKGINDYVKYRKPFKVTLETKDELWSLKESIFNLIDASKQEYCLLYTSDAADDLLCVDLGGRRIIKKKTKK